MELSPDSQPAAEYATLPQPDLVRNLSFWLLTILLGSVFMLLLPTLTTSTNNKDSYGFLVAVAGFASILSLAALPLLPWALTAPSVGLRWLRVFTLQSLSLGGLTALGYKMAGGSSHGGFGAVALLVGTIYFVAGLLVAAAVYWPWLRRPH